MPTTATQRARESEKLMPSESLPPMTQKRKAFPPPPPPPAPEKEEVEDDAEEEIEGGDDDDDDKVEKEKEEEEDEEEDEEEVSEQRLLEKTDCGMGGDCIAALYAAQMASDSDARRGSTKTGLFPCSCANSPDALQRAKTCSMY